MWRAVGGNTPLIEPVYCIRGLELYESAELNARVLAARSAYLRTILHEQARQGAAGVKDEEALAQSVASRSA